MDNGGHGKIEEEKSCFVKKAMFMQEKYRELLAFVFTYIIKCVTFSLLFMLTKRLHMPIV